ncbi:MAG: SCO family protein [Myxococcota bacterium]
MRRLGLAALLLSLAVLGCDAQHSERARRVEARGVVEAVDPALRQVVIDHDDIPGVMPAMSMSFDVGDSYLLEGLEPGQTIEFTLELNSRSMRVVAARVVAQAGEASCPGSLGFDGAVAERSPAPDFSLVDQDGRPVSLGSLRGKVLLLDFVYTHCPGPCPILTGTHVSVQRALPPELTEKVHFVSISLDPERDTPEAFRRYAEARGVDLATWSFLGGAPDAVGDVIARYGVGATPGENGEIEHLVITYLIDAEGRIARRFAGLEHRAKTLVAAIAAVAG